ncbi:MAG: polyphosphate kinase 1 [Saprospiraceae bacterium]|nr:polyphosphate kinase 1 [Saprospiraceae bacterium]
MHADVATSQSQYVERDISWLSFNYRVLQEAKDPSVPLLERLKFLAIYSSNLGEFFRVRVANHRNLIRLGKKTRKKLDYDPEATLNEIIRIVRDHMKEFSRIFDEEVIPGLRQNNISILRRKELNKEQVQFISEYFVESMLPFCQPVLLFEHNVKPFLNDAELYLALDMILKETDGNEHYYGIVKIPSDHRPRFIELPSKPDSHDIIMLDDVVRHNASVLFPGFDIQDSYSIKVTRDAELYIDDEYSGDLLQKIKNSLAKRNVGPASRLVYDVNMPKKMLKYLVDVLELENSDLIPESKYHNNFDFFQFPDFGKKHLKDTPLPPIPYKPLESTSNLLGAIERRDHFINVPYHSYESVIRFFEQSAVDPEVTHIKIVQYRVARDSRIMDALIQAAENGKNVFVFIEVKARFDEEANLKWGEKLESSGIRVRYSFPGLKVHSKIALIRKVTQGESKLYSYLSTGNFHEGTAKLYSDFGFFTYDKRITKEVARLFRFLETVVIPEAEFKKLLVGQFNLYQSLVDLVEKEIENAEKGLPAFIDLKLNSLQDLSMVKLLEKAQRKGVKIRLIVRGICCLNNFPDEENPPLNVISIVDRFLEHARVYVFGNGGDPLVYISSADWMIRNLHHRIETAIPIFNKEIKKEIRELYEIQWKDNVKARVVEKDHKNHYKKTGSDISFRSQLETYLYYKRKAENE